MASTGRLCPKLVTFFTIQVYERVGRSVVSVSKKTPKGLTDVKKSKKRYDFFIYSYFKESSRRKGCKVLN